jgi:hypothetical protein
MIKFDGFVMELLNTRNRQDRRKKEDRYVLSYKDESGLNYWRHYCCPVGTSFEEVKKNIPVFLKEQ